MTYVVCICSPWYIYIGKNYLRSQSSEGLKLTGCVVGLGKREIAVCRVDGGGQKHTLLIFEPPLGEHSYVRWGLMRQVSFGEANVYQTYV